MTVSSSTNKAIHTGDNVIVEFAYTYRMDEDSDMQVYLDEVLQSAGYSVARGIDDIGGTVTFGVPPATGVLITLLRVLNLDQETDYVPYDAFPAESHEDALDKLTMISQQQQEQVDRNTQAIGSSGGEDVDTTAPPFDANKAWKWDDGTNKKIINSTYDPDEQATLAAASASAASDSALEATVAAVAAQTAQGYAFEWSSFPENSIVDDGINTGYSAYHWSKKAEGNAAGVVSINGETGAVTGFQKQAESMPARMWDVGRAYLIGDLVTLDKVTYIALTNNTGANPETEDTDWEIAASKEQGGVAWNDTADYLVGDMVVDDDIAYLATADNTNDQPPSANWTKVGGGSGVWLGDTPPADKETYPVWFKTDTGKTWTWYDDGDTTQWIQDVAQQEGASGSIIEDGSITTAKLANEAVTSAKMDVAEMQAAGLLPTAWCTFVGSTGEIVAGFGFSSVVRNSAGYYTASFSTPMDTDNYMVQAQNNGGTSTADTNTNSNTVNGFDLQTGTFGSGISNAFSDAALVSLLIFGGKN